MLVVSLYKAKVEEAQNHAKQVYEKWHEVEKEFKLMKIEGFKDKLQKAAINQKRKILKIEYTSGLNTLSVILISIRTGNYI